MADALHYVKQKDWKANALQSTDMTTLIMYFLGRKLRSTHLRQDDSEAAHGARRLWPSAEEECDSEHSEEPWEDPRLCEKWRDGLCVLEEKTTYVKWTDDGTKSWKNFVNFIYNLMFFLVKWLYSRPCWFLMREFNTCAVYSSQCNIYFTQSQNWYSSNVYLF